MNQNIITSISNMIAENQLQEAITKLRVLLTDSPILKQVILQSSRYNDLKQQITNGTLSIENTDIGKNKIRLALIEIVGLLEEKGEEDPAINEILVNYTKGSELSVNKLNSGEGIYISAKQKASKAQFKDLDTKGKINIDITQE